MKKLLILIFLLVATLGFGQEYTIQSIFDDFEANAQVEQFDHVIVLYDNIEVDSTNIIFRLSYLLRTVEFYFNVNKMDIEMIPHDFKLFIYETNEFMLEIPSQWVLDYYKSDSITKAEMIREIFNNRFESFQMEQKDLGNVKQYR